MMRALHLGVDVGTGSARAGLFDTAGALHGMSRAPFTTRRDGPRAEQSSAEIWDAVCAATRAAMEAAGAAPDEVRGIGFDAACSMVVLAEGGPVGVGDEPGRDVIVWMDHRATEQAARINAGDHAVLAYVGGAISPEMQVPKLLWLREHRPRAYASAARFLDLADFLTWRATGDDTRSVCTLSCKWTYLAHEGRFDPAFFRAVGLGDLADDGFARIGSRVAAPGAALGDGLTEAAAQAMGLRPGVPVAAGLIDAHAGGLGTVGAPGGDPCARMAYVFGTSACTMTSSTEARFVPGVWGPYLSAMIPGLWLLEGGQSAAGAAIDRLLDGHAASAEMRGRAGDVPLAAHLSALAAADGGGDPAALAGGRVVVPDFLGNRAPLADPSRRAVIAGLGPETGAEDLLATYVAGLCGIGYGLRQILDAQREAGLEVSEVVISGGAGGDPIVRRVLADAARVPVAVPDTPEPVLLGAAMLGTLASGAQRDARDAMAAMSSVADRIDPRPTTADWHDRAYQRFLALQAAAAR